MNNNMRIENWFPDELSDEAACAIHLFLEEFSVQFRERYYLQIRRHIELVRDDGRHQQADAGTLQEDDRVPF